MAGLGACGGAAPGPEILSLRYLGPYAKDGQTIEMELRFRADPAACQADEGTCALDLYDGRLHLYLQDDPIEPVALAALYADQSPPLPPSTTEGALLLRLWVQRISGEALFPGDPLKVGAELEDARGLRSTYTWLRLRRRPGEDGF